MSVVHVVHRTTFTYQSQVEASYNEVRMRPINTPGQRVISTRLSVALATWTGSYMDYFGNHVDSIEVLRPHDALVIVSDSQVARDDVPAAPVGISFDELNAKSLRDRQVEWLSQTPTTQPGDEVAELAREASAGLAPHDAAMAVCNMVHSNVEYLAGVTTVHSRAVDAWNERKGVCQDIAHLSIGALRSVGIPARYVSGYIHSGDDLDETVGESHAWVEFFTGSWYGYDPTNVVDIAGRHVLVARGRDYRDVSPLRGVYSGGGAAEQGIEVRVRVSDQ